MFMQGEGISVTAHQGVHLGDDGQIEKQLIPPIAVPRLRQLQRVLPGFAPRQQIAQARWGDRSAAIVLISFLGTPIPVLCGGCQPLVWRQFDQDFTPSRFKRRLLIPEAMFTINS